MTYLEYLIIMREEIMCPDKHNRHYHSFVHDWCWDTTWQRPSHGLICHLHPTVSPSIFCHFIKSAHIPFHLLSGAIWSLSFSIMGSHYTHTHTLPIHFLAPFYCNRCPSSFHTSSDPDFYPNRTFKMQLAKGVIGPVRLTINKAPPLTLVHRQRLSTYFTVNPWTNNESWPHTYPFLNAFDLPKSLVDSH